LNDVRDFFHRKFTAIPGVYWYEEGVGSLMNKDSGGNFNTHFDAMDYMFGGVPPGSILLSYDSDVFFWDMVKLKHYINLVESGQYDIVGCTPAGCGTQIAEEVEKRFPPANVHPHFVIIRTDDFEKVRPQPGVTAFGRPVRWRPYVWKAGSIADQFGKQITEDTAVDVFGWASVELFDRLHLNRFYHIDPSPRYQEAYDSFIGEPGWCHPAATSSLMYIWRTLMPGLEKDIPAWTRKRCIFGVARQLLGLRRLEEDGEFMELKTAQACIDEAQDGLEYICKVKGIGQADIEEMQRRILEHYPL
jgi:hypothetical protein